MISRRVRSNIQRPSSRACVISSDRSTSAFMSDINRVIPPITREQVEWEQFDPTVSASLQIRHVTMRPSERYLNPGGFKSRHRLRAMARRMDIL